MTHTPLTRSLVRIGAMASKETIHILRDPRTLALALAMPVLMLFLFGYGVSVDLDRLPIAFADQDQSEASRALARAFEGSHEFHVVSHRAPAEAEALFRDGSAVAALVVPRGYQDDLLKGRKTPVQLLVDGADPVVANQVLTKADGVVRASASWAAGSAQSSVRRRSPVRTACPSRTFTSRMRAPTREERSTTTPSTSPEPPDGAARARACVQSRREMRAPRTMTRAARTMATRRMRVVLRRGVAPRSGATGAIRVPRPDRPRAGGSAAQSLPQLSGNPTGRMEGRTILG